MTGNHHTHDEGETLRQLRDRLQAESSESLELIAAPEDNPICSISYDENIPGVVILWKRYATSTQLRFIHEHMLHMLRHHRVSKILGDDTALAAIHEEDQKWITGNWMPRAAAAGFRAGASKSPLSYFGRQAVSDVRAHAPDSLTIRAFEDIAEAREWLAAYDA